MGPHRVSVTILFGLERVKRQKGNDFRSVGWGCGEASLKWAKGAFCPERERGGEAFGFV